MNTARIRRLDIVGAPSSAGAYAPGQENAPQAIRDAGLVTRLAGRGIPVLDRGDVVGFRWRPDRTNPRAMNAGAAADVARAVATRVQEGLAEGAAILVLGGDCTVELGSVAGASVDSHDIGLVYVDLDTDLNTPASTEDGALDWMGVAHMLGLDDTVPALAGLGTRMPILDADQLLLFANDNSTAFERAIIEERGIAEVPLREVIADSAGSGRAVAEGWARRFSRLLVHVDVDVLDYVDMPIAENTRRYRGLRFGQLLAALGGLTAAPNWAVLTLCEVNPDHCEPDGATLRTLTEGLAGTLASAARLRLPD